MTKTSEQHILTSLRSIERNQNIENRGERLEGLQRDNNLLRGYIERIEEKLKALEDHLGIEYIKNISYKIK